MRALLRRINLHNEDVCASARYDTGISGQTGTRPTLPTPMIHSWLLRPGRCTGLAPIRILRVPALDAYPSGYHLHRHAWREMAPGDVALLLAGPLGRVLGVEWFTRRPEITMLELGSFFDPELYAPDADVPEIPREPGKPPRCREMSCDTWTASPRMPARDHRRCTVHAWTFCIWPASF